MTSFARSTTTSLASCLAEARTAAGTENYLSQSQCVDSLLDCFNAAVRPCVRTVVAEALAAISHVGLVEAAEFLRALDEVQLAIQIDAAFDHLELAA